MAALTLTATACSPPHAFTVGTHDFATNVLLNAEANARQSSTVPPAVGSAPPSAAKLSVGLPFVPAANIPKQSAVVIPLPIIPQVKPPTGCPPITPDTTVGNPAVPTPPGPPVAAAYSYRQSGTYRITGPHAKTGSFAPHSTRQVTNVTALPQGGWSFTMKDDQGLSVTYTVYPQQVAAAQDPQTQQQQQGPIQAGIYISQLTVRRTDGSSLTLNPQPMVMVAQLPFAAGTQWKSKGVDPTTGIAVVVNGQVGLGSGFKPFYDNIAACGNLIQGWWVQYTVDTVPAAAQTAALEPPSELYGTTIDENFSGTDIAFGSEYGGIPLEEIDTVNGTDGSDRITIVRRDVITAVPAQATSPSSTGLPG
jgi:hypothetical protein